MQEKFPNGAGEQAPPRVEGLGAHRRSRSAVWVYYAAIALLATVLGFAHPATFLVALAAALYARYLYKGGRWVFWIW